MDKISVCHVCPFTQLLNVESRSLTKRMRISKINDLIQFCFLDVSFHVELCTSLRTTENNKMPYRPFSLTG